MNEIPQAHLLDAMSMYCVKCGISFQHIERDRDFECPGAPNIVAISHIVRAKRIADLCRLGGGLKP